MLLVELFLSEGSLLVKTFKLFSKTVELCIELLLILLWATEDLVLQISDLIVSIVDILLRLREEFLPLWHQSGLVILDQALLYVFYSGCL